METTYSNPPSLIISDPINLDKEIQEIQIKLGLLPWLDKPFGRARTGRDDSGKTFPEVYKGDGEYHNCFPNDHLKSQSFIRVKGDQSRRNYPTPTNRNDRFTKAAQSVVDIIFWFDLKKINPSVNYRFDEELKKDIAEIIETMPQLKLITIYEAPEDVFQGYTLDFSNPNIFRYPYGGFRFECQLDYTEQC
jgi:hypothetical protein